ncbi:DNA alkylation repair protein [Aquabacterium lacunae]|uniref:DNA alkylation repair protein n=1 Tax=Aquabacterium lacunae TaxID=2528630 RepID=A0A4Q9H648_9BURK|nr:DNA alkylation repair protein [Aquabacterium lacunae]TBO34207.1 DNA alkylation repair protein [Aquabacterium lacunae]
MAEAFKHLIGAHTVAEVGHHLKRVWPAFDRPAFERQALADLDTLEFKARAVHLGNALASHLPPDFEHATAVLVASLKAVPPPAHHHDPDAELGQLQTDATGVAGWALWAYGDFVARHGQAHVPQALIALHAITQRFTAEFAIRPFLVNHPEAVLAVLRQWQHDPSAHVRRLVSEGSRPRLPWGLRLQALVQDPTPTLPLLRTLQDDPSEYVRRSVANHLNDIGKDHPGVLVQWLQEHLPGAPITRQRLLRHASRHLIKAGHPGVLQAWGLGLGLQGHATLQAAHPQVQIGQKLPIHIRVHASPDAPVQSLEVDYRVHHIKADGSTSPKAFKGKRITLPPGETVAWQKLHSFVPVSTRVLRPGLHRIDLQVNGQLVAETEVLLLDVQV